MRIVTGPAPRRTVAAVLATLAVAALAVACRATPDPTPPAAVTGDRARGAEVITEAGCASCHVIPGIDQPFGGDAYVGPPLDRWSRRAFIAGTTQNNAENLEAFLLDPDSVRPGTAMPDLGLTEDEARDVTAYLLGLG